MSYAMVLKSRSSPTNSPPSSNKQKITPVSHRSKPGGSTIEGNESAKQGLKTAVGDSNPSTQKTTYAMAARKSLAGPSVPTSSTSATQLRPTPLATNAPTTENPDNKWTERDNKTFVDQQEQLSKLLADTLDAILTSPNLKSEVEFFCDMEGENLGRKGTSSLFQMTIVLKKHTWVFDLVVLPGVFDTLSPKGHSIREALQSKDICTAWWDCRNDQNALWFHHQVRLHPSSTLDLQLRELATRSHGPLRGRKEFGHRAGLGLAIEWELRNAKETSEDEISMWVSIKKLGRSALKAKTTPNSVFVPCLGSVGCMLDRILFTARCFSGFILSGWASPSSLQSKYRTVLVPN